MGKVLRAMVRETSSSTDLKPKIYTVVLGWRKWWGVSDTPAMRKETEG